MRFSKTNIRVWLIFYVVSISMFFGSLLKIIIVITKSIWIRDAEDAEEPYTQVSDYRVWENAGRLILALGDTIRYDETVAIRIEYVAEYTQLLKDRKFWDGAEVGGDLETILLKAKRYWYERKMQSASGADRDWYAQMVRFTIEEMDKRDDSRRRPPSRARMQVWGGDRYRQPTRREIDRRW